MKFYTHLKHHRQLDCRLWKWKVSKISLITHHHFLLHKTQNTSVKLKRQSLSIVVNVVYASYEECFFARQTRRWNLESLSLLSHLFVECRSKKEKCQLRRECRNRRNRWNFESEKNSIEFNELNLKSQEVSRSWYVEIDKCDLKLISWR